MKYLYISLVLVAHCATAAAMEQLPSSAEPSVPFHVASLNAEKQAGNVAPGGRAIAPADEKNLLKALELPSNDSVEPQENPDGFAEFELKIPDYNLPDSDIPLTINSKVTYFIHFFQTSGRSWFGKWLSRSERYIPMMKEILQREGLPEDLVYLAMIESGFSPYACSPANAAGPWQFIAGTGKRYSLRIDPWIDERRDPLKSTVAAAMYLKELYQIFNKDWYLAAAGYNAGENKILRAMDMYESTDFWEISQGAYLKRETKDYVPRLLAAAIIAKEPAKYGFADVAYLPPVEFDTVPIPSRTDLELVARILDISYDTIRELNPELKKWCTPPDYPGYLLKIPKGMRERFLSAFAAVPADQRYTERIEYVSYKAGKRDTLASVARRFGARPDEIAALNGLKRNARLRGKRLRVPVREGVPRHDSTREKASTPSVLDPVGTVADNEIVRYYTVKRGDTLSSLARRFNVSTRIIAAWNNMEAKAHLKPGDRLIVARFSEKKMRPAGQADEKG